jgi:diaminohydroxyphosphoribosylaminopyrimidine deaminase / 5-amino-6-(5-phosphoribosylamino)uracil reductase
MDRQFMQRALEIAERGRGLTSPNPVVGAVVVSAGRVAGEGFHERYGGPHAEVNALDAAGAAARGATLYVTLEPCCTWGNTPPCTDAILRAGVSHVLVAIEDPNPNVSGRGVAELERAGVRVEVGLLREEAAAANAAYLKFRATGLPFVVLKMALSLDGKGAAPAGGPRWISCEDSRAKVHEMRGATDCVMVGVGTVIADDPALTDRRPDGGRRQPARLVVDPMLRTPDTSALVAGARNIRTIVACAKDAPNGRQRSLEGLGAAVWRCRAEGGRLDLEDVLGRAAGAGMTSVLCEGGPTLATSLLREGLVDRVAFFVAPTLVGSEGTPAFGALERSWWSRAAGFADVRWTQVGCDLLLEARVDEPARRRTTCSQGS